MERKGARLCSLLLALALALSLLPMEALAEEDESVWDYSVSDNEATINHYHGAGGDVEILAELGGCPVTSIGQFAFAANYGLTSVTIPSGVTSIGEGAFSACYNLKDIWFLGSRTQFDAIPKSQSWNAGIGYSVGGCTIHYNTAYPLWVGGVQVTEDNQNDILNDGGTAKFEVRDGENILTLNNANITATSTIKHSGGVTYNDVVYARGLALTVSLAGRNTLGDGSADFAINSDSFGGSLAIMGGGSLTASVSYNALLAYDDISITGSTVTATLSKYDGIFAHNSVTITDSTVTATSGRYGITAYWGSFTVSGDSVVTASGGKKAIYASSVTLNDGLGYIEGSADAKKAVIGKPPHVHSYGDPTWTWTQYGDTWTAKATFTCADGDDTQVLDATVTSTTTPASCTAAGETAYTASVMFEGTTYITEGDDIKRVSIPMTAHDWQWVTDQEPTCGEAGTKHEECSVCHAARSENTEIPATGTHTEVIDPAVPATCTETGLTEGKHCSVCGIVLIEQKEVPAIGHDWGEWTVTKEATVYEEGEKTRVCKNDPAHVETRTIPKKEKPMPPIFPYFPIIPNPIVPEIPVTPVEPVSEKPALPFIDVTKDMDIYDDVKYVYEKGIMVGVSDTLFGPELSLTRGMIVTILHRMEGEPKVSYSGVFTDVLNGQWYTDGVEWAASVGIVLGYSDGTYGVNDSVTREQLAAILHRYAKFKGYDVSVGEDTNILSYDDAFDISGWAMPSMQWACGAGVLNSGKNAAIRPTEPATRSLSDRQGPTFPDSGKTSCSVFPH